MSCGPESGCDADCMTAAYMAEVNATIARARAYLATYGEPGGGE